MTAPEDAPPETRSGRVVLLAGPGDATNVVFHYLREAFDDVVVVQEDRVSRISLSRRRARRLGWWTVAGQVTFVSLVMPLLRWRARRRIAEILVSSHLDSSPIAGAHRVTSVNDLETLSTIRQLDPDVVVVHGTRIISPATLEALKCPAVNLHAGITPRYRGVHGGYWAQVEGRSDLFGSTVHLVDAGIDTGAVLAQGIVFPSPEDSIASYPYLQLTCGLPILEEQVNLILGRAPRGQPAGPSLSGTEGESILRSHPTAWQYIWLRLSRGVR